MIFVQLCDNPLTSPAINLLLKQELSSPLAEHSIAAISVLQHGAHGLPHRVESVDLKELLLRDFIADSLVVSAQVQG